MKLRLETWVIAAFLIGSISLLAWFNISKPRVLILHSYDKEYSWVRDVNIGLKRTLDKRRDISIRWHYLDTKRHPSAEYKVKAGITARTLIDKINPDVIIAVDDDAQQYVTRYYLNHPHIKIVFAGVNNEPQTYDFDHASNVTGILERVPLDALKESLLIAAQRNGLKLPLRIRFIGDQSETVKGDEKFFSSYAWAPFKILDSRLVKTFAEWQQVVLESAGKTDFLITSNYRKVMHSDSDPTLVPANELIAWTESHSTTPVIGTNGFFAEDGGMLAIGTSPYEQGEVAARLATEILDHGKQPNQLPILATRQFVVAMRNAEIQKRHFDLPKVYEAAARASNKFFD